MTSTHEALVRRPLGEVERQLQDSEQVLTALPGTTLTRAADGVSGSLRLKLGSLQITYRVTIRATGPDGAVHLMTVAVSGKEARGAGTLAATVQVELHEAEDDATLLRAILDVTATGRGESVPEAAWGRAADTLLAGVVAGLTEAAAAPVAAAPAPHEPPSTARDAVTAQPPPPVRPVPLTDRPPMPATAHNASGLSPRHLAAAAAFVLMLLVVLRGRRRGRSG
jgi:carbon monoxide dehydrogenase subunit G